MATRRAFLLSSAWIQAIVLVFLCGFFVLGLLAYKTYVSEPPIPTRVVAPGGQTLFTGDDITAGQETFLRNGLMQYGSIFGHGAYLGPDFTADYLHRAAVIVNGLNGDSDQGDAQAVTDFQVNRYDPRSHVLTYTAGQAAAFQQLEHYYAGYFGQPDTATGLRSQAIPDPAAIHELTAFFSWTAWAASARRPNKNYGIKLADAQSPKR